MRFPTITLSCCLLGACAIVGPDEGAGESGTDSESSSSAESGIDSTSSETSSDDTGVTECGSQSCSEDEWCEWPLHECGGNDDVGSCEPRPDSCPGDGSPVCGCDGMVYPNICVAQQAGVSYWNNATHCSTPAGMYPCGPNFCSSETEYCWYQATDVWSDPGYYACLDLPSGCTSCDCVSLDEFCSCSIVGNHVQVSCDAP